MEVAAIILAILFVVFAFSVFFGAPFVPTRRKWAKNALELADIKQSDVVIDLGSG